MRCMYQKNEELIRDKYYETDRMQRFSIVLFIILCRKEL